MSRGSASTAHHQALDAIQKAANMTAEDAREYLEMLTCAGVHVMRAKFGDDYARGWLEHAIADLDHPPLVELRKPQ